MKSHSNSSIKSRRQHTRNAFIITRAQKPICSKFSRKEISIWIFFNTSTKKMIFLLCNRNTSSMSYYCSMAKNVQHCMINQLDVCVMPLSRARNLIRMSDSNFKINVTIAFLIKITRWTKLINHIFIITVFTSTWCVCSSFTVLNRNPITRVFTLIKTMSTKLPFLKRVFSMCLTKRIFSSWSKSAHKRQSNLCNFYKAPSEINVILLSCMMMSLKIKARVMPLIIKNAYNISYTAFLMCCSSLLIIARWLVMNTFTIPF